MKRFFACLILAAVLMTGDAATARDVLVNGSGTNLCGSWTTNARVVVPGQPITPSGLSYMRQGEWVLGFLAGAAVMGGDLNPLNGTDTDGVFAWIDNYCGAHPLEMISDAAHAFVTAHPR